MNTSRWAAGFCAAVAAVALSACTSPTPGPQPTASSSPAGLPMAQVASQGALTGTFGLPPDAGPLEQLTVVGAGDVNVAVGGTTAQGFSPDGKQLWSTQLPGFVTRGAVTTAGDVVVALTSDGTKDGTSRLVFVRAGTGEVLASPVVAEVLAGDVAAAGGVVVLTADHLKDAPSTATGFSPTGDKLWQRTVPARTRRAQPAGDRLLLTTLPDFAPDNTPATRGQVTVINPATGATVGTVKARYRLFENPPVVSGDRFWVLTDDATWREFDASARPTGAGNDGAMVGGGVHAYRWSAGWAAGQGKAARVGPAAVVADEDATSTVWNDPTQPFPRVLTRPADGSVRAYVPAPPASRLAPAAVLRAQTVTALTCKDAGAGPDQCAVTTWRLPR